MARRKAAHNPGPGSKRDKYRRQTTNLRGAIGDVSSHWSHGALTSPCARVPFRNSGKRSGTGAPYHAHADEFSYPLAFSSSSNITRIYAGALRIRVGYILSLDAAFSEGLLTMECRSRTP